MKRKLIGLITAFPESLYTRRVMDGVFSQCERYGYDVAVFSPMTLVCSYDKKFLAGELNIYELINYDLLDGIILDTISLTEDREEQVISSLQEKLSRRFSGPVVSLDIPVGEHHVCRSNDRALFREITSHVLDVHKCKRIYFLSGMKEHDVSQQRLGGFLDEMSERGLSVNEGDIFYGDFWFTSGTQLAKRITQGEVPMPQAVICASDHMAIGLVNELVKSGVKVPEDIIVTGFDATLEAGLNDISVTSFVPCTENSAAQAVDYLRSVLEPQAEITPAELSLRESIRTGMSCGCDAANRNKIDVLRQSTYLYNRDQTDPRWLDSIDLGTLLESYMYEHLAGSSDIEECLKKIYEATYLLRPYAEFYLCLCDGWLKAENCPDIGYPKLMRTVVHATPENDSGHFCSGAEPFEARLMLPQLSQQRETPSVFYFTAVHFNEKNLGYAVLRCELSQQHKVGTVYRNWLRNVNNSLETIRAHNELLMLSITDRMTGAYNRLGMELRLNEMLGSAKQGDSVAVFVVDMDGLKYINDNFGHEQGDIGISMVCSAAREVMLPNEILVRAGGDEFYIIGVGDYPHEQAAQRLEQFSRILERKSRSIGKDFEIGASIGYSCAPYQEGIKIDSVISPADKAMYRSKVERKRQRI